MNLNSMSPPGVSLNPSMPMGNFSDAPVILGEQNGRHAGIEGPPGLAQYTLNPYYHYSNLNGTNLASGAAPYLPI